MNAAGRSSASRSSNRNYRRNQRARRRPIRGSRQALRSYHRGEARPCAVSIVELGGIEGQAALHVRLMTSPRRTGIPNTTNAAQRHLVAVDRTSSGKRLCCHASMRSKFTSVAMPRRSSTGPRPPPCAESSRGEPRSSRRFRRTRRPHLRNPLIECEDRTLRAVLVGMLRETDRGQPPAKLRRSWVTQGPCDGLVRRSSVCSPSWRGLGSSWP